ncbi:response regulator [Halobaculum sp. MBLA0147]|uniref:response regulator n=1 Tax=Halobaculum sp. MBLA0147 TaxID=3079934 RepID=UPI003525D7CA
MQRVLIVDDSGFQRTLVRDAVSDEYDVVGEAENGVEAVDKFEQLSPDIVTMDIMMPAMNGVEAVEEIKGQSPDTTVVMITSVEQREMMKKAVAAGADAYVTKPFDGDEVREELASVA